MKIIVAPNAFKGSLTAIDAARAIKKGILTACPNCEVITVPVADGGDGFSGVMIEALQGVKYEINVTGPRMRSQRASFGYIQNTGVAMIEMAQASGLALLPLAEQDPTETTTLGTGELILAALNEGASKIVIGLGGSATCDGGIGMASALGYRFLDKDGLPLAPIGKSLIHIHSIDTAAVDHRINTVKFTAACDVTNPLFGPNGASHIYSPQKGASEQQVLLLDHGLKNLAAVIYHDLGIDVSGVSGGGAAGGLGAALMCFLGAKLEKGIDIVMDLVQLRQKIHNADLVITGEGQIDFQTKFDKAPAGVAHISKEAQVPCIAICGGVGEKIEELYDIGICAVFSICQKPLSLEKAIENSFELLAHTTEQVVRTFQVSQKNRH